MQEYDAALKLLLQSSATVAMRELTGTTVERWLDVELPNVQNPRVDLLGETAGGELIHVELQSTNDSTMPLRMMEYCVRIYRLLDRFPRQVLVYVGEAPLRMASGLEGPDLVFRYRALDIRELDAAPLLASEQVGDNILAVLAKLPDQKEGVRRILRRIAALEGDRRATAMAELMILAGLRKLAGVVKEEAEKMPIVYNIRENEALKPEFQRVREEGREEGRETEVRLLLRRILERRFGPLPEWASEHLDRRSIGQLEDLAERAIDAPGLIELLR